MTLNSLGGQVRVCIFPRYWQGCNYAFEQHGFAKKVNMYAALNGQLRHLGLCQYALSHILAHKLGFINRSITML